ncbi:MAG: MotA/TolQ/ExbB proton channel family protein [Ruminococcus sp.]|nr:MotA/TolQ/ExbB proton channel family protein [Ruminococcus sp.]
MKDFFSVIFINFIGFDMIIFIVAVVNGVFYHFAKRATNELYEMMHLTVFVPGSAQSQEEARTAVSELRETEVVKKRDLMGRLYSVFVNLTGIFPLLGILGTVSSLLGLVKDMTDVEGSFYGALTSTFWGLVFAITFKLLDGVISAKIEDNEKTVALYLARNGREN